MTDNVVSLAEHTDDNRRWSIEQMLEDTLKRVRAGEAKGTKGFVCLIDDETKDYDLIRCRMNGGDMVLITTVMQSRWVNIVRGRE